MACVIAEKTTGGQADSHLVTSVQLQGHGNCETVLLVLRIDICRPSHHSAVDLQIGTDGQWGTARASVTVGCEGQAVDSGVGNSEDAGSRIVAVAQV